MNQPTPAARGGAHGPYEIDSEAMRDSAHVHQAYRAAYERGLMDRINEGMLLGALREAGVRLGAYDERIAGWLADWEPHVVQVLIGWIERAHAAGHCATDEGAHGAETAAAPEPEFTHHAVMRNGIADAECGTWHPWELMTGAWKDVTCPDCLATLDDDGNGGAPCA